MTDLEALYRYRLKEAENALRDAKAILKHHLTTRAAINRAYYAIFYAALALFLKENLLLKTSKHKGVVAFFDKEFVHTNKFNKKYSMIFHSLFSLRQKGDYEDFIEITTAEAKEKINLAKDFISEVKKYIKTK